jgi:hypothetical protein
MYSDMWEMVQWGVTVGCFCFRLSPQSLAGQDTALFYGPLFSGFVLNPQSLAGRNAGSVLSWKCSGIIVIELDDSHQPNGIDRGIR